MDGQQGGLQQDNRMRNASAGSHPSPETQGLLVRIELDDNDDHRDDRWLDEVAQLVENLAEDVGDVDMDHTPVLGHKGGVDAIIVALGSAGAFTALVQLLRAWLARERSRSVTLEWDLDGHSGRVSVHSDYIDNAALKELALAVAKRRG